MIEDPLGRNERIRLEALAQSISSLQGILPVGEILIIDRAKKFEAYIRNDEEENQNAST